MSNLGEGIAERTEERVTAQHVTSMFRNNYRPEQIAGALNLDLDRVTTILCQQGLLQS